MPLPLHRIRFTWGSDRLIEIEWAKGSGVPTAIPTEETNCCLLELEAEPDEFALRGIPAICWRDDVPPLFERFQLRENTEYFVDITLPLGKSDAEARFQKNRAWPFSDRLVSIFRPDPPRRWRETPTGNAIVSGQLRLKNHAGILDLSTEFDMPLRAEVVCRKMDYHGEFQRLLNEIAEQLVELLLQYDSPMSFSFDVSDAWSENEAGLLFQMRYVMDPENLPIAVEELLSAFHSRLIEHQTIENIVGVEEPRVDVLIDELDVSVLGRGGPLARLFGGYTPREIAVVENLETFDTPENRYVKYFLEECLLIAQRLAKTLHERRKPAASREAQEWIGRIEELLGHSQWSEVRPLRQFPSNSQVLQKRRGYREILKFDLSLRLGLELNWKRGEDISDGLLGDVRPVHEIYEYWCFFVLRRVLMELCVAELPGNGSFIAVAPDGLQVRLEKGKRSRISFIYREVGARKLQICLFYNRRFKRPSRALTTWDGSYTAFFDPDYSILVSLHEGDTTRRHWLHFDAKYRLEVGEAEALFSGIDDPASVSDDELTTEYDRELARIHKRDDLFKMHTYRDGILSSRGAYILFPGNGVGLRYANPQQNLFVRHPSAFSGMLAHRFPSVGAFDLCPGRDDAQVATVRDFLRDIFDAILAGGSYAEEAGPF